MISRCGKEITKLLYLIVSRIRYKMKSIQKYIYLRCIYDVVMNDKSQSGLQLVEGTVYDNNYMGDCDFKRAIAFTNYVGNRGSGEGSRLLIRAVDGEDMY